MVLATTKTRTHRPLLRHMASIVGVSVAVASVLTLLAPRVTLVYEVGDRLLFWTLLCLIGGAGMFTFERIARWRAPTLSVWTSAIGSTLLGTLFVLIAVYSVYSPQDLPTRFVTVAIVWSVMAIMALALFFVGRSTRRDAGSASSATPEAPSTDGTPPIVRRLPAHLHDAELYALSAEDHYVRVHTEKGEALILMRLRDAVEETGDVPGLQTHRSWWVAKPAVANITRSGRTTRIRLKGGGTVPVSRSGHDALKANGWF